MARSKFVRSGPCSESVTAHDHQHVQATAEAVARRSYGKLVAFLAARTGDVAGAEDALSDRGLSVRVRPCPQKLGRIGIFSGLAVCTRPLLSASVCPFH